MNIPATQDRVLGLLRMAVEPDVYASDHPACVAATGLGYTVLTGVRQTPQTTTWLAEAPQSEELVVIKGAGAGCEAWPPDRVQRFEAELDHEARLLKRLQRPGGAGVPLLDRIEPGGVARFLAMQYIDGTPINQAMAEAGSDRERLRLADRLLALVSEVHALGVVHRDLKPEHVLVTALGEVHLIDFGLACESETDGCVLRASTLLAGGTPRYMAPECRPEKLPRLLPRLDVYALGVMLDELFPEGDAARRPVIPLIQAATREDPDARPQDAGQLLYLWRRRDARRRFAWRLGGGTGGFALVAGALSALNVGGGPTPTPTPIPDPLPAVTDSLQPVYGAAIVNHERPGPAALAESERARAQGDVWLADLLAHAATHGALFETVRPASVGSEVNLGAVAGGHMVWSVFGDQLLWFAEDGALFALPSESDPTVITAESSGRWLTIGSEGDAAFFTGPKPSGVTHRFEGSPTQAAFASGTAWVHTRSGDSGTVYAWDPDTGAVHASIEAHTAFFSPVGPGYVLGCSPTGDGDWVLRWCELGEGGVTRHLTAWRGPAVARGFTVIPGEPPVAVVSDNRGHLWRQTPTEADDPVQLAGYTVLRAAPGQNLLFGTHQRGLTILRLDPLRVLLDVPIDGIVLDAQWDDKDHTLHFLSVTGHHRLGAASP